MVAYRSWRRLALLQIGSEEIFILSCWLAGGPGTRLLPALTYHLIVLHEHRNSLLQDQLAFVCSSRRAGGVGGFHFKHGGSLDRAAIARAISRKSENFFSTKGEGGDQQRGR